MTSATSTPGSVEATTALLQAELPRLEVRQQDLEKELVTVSERLESVRTALSALQALATAPPVLTTTSVDDGPSASSSGSEAEAHARPTTTQQEQQEPGLSAVTGDVPEAAVVPAPRKAGRTAADAVRTASKTTAKQKKERTSKKAAPAKSEKAQTAEKAAPAASAKDGGRLIEQVMEVVAAAGGAPVRARDVTEALGRELTAGSINTVRSTLDRLVATSRAHRAGRGLYQAPAE
ncbi:hypothetical protein ACFVXE_21205 [Streptomyces sp. NPDC058231]|uniref:hypothetical protein n=1 Tax=Streptomyces sp. NPDC058231 TaxID=3346392 RepID=UPI0036F01325